VAKRKHNMVDEAMVAVVACTTQRIDRLPELHPAHGSWLLRLKNISVIVSRTPNSTTTGTKNNEALGIYISGPRACKPMPRYSIWVMGQAIHYAVLAGDSVPLT
jgi:hypothetical protein